MIQSIKNFYHKLQSLLANLKYGKPARELTIIGVTGTDGKTTTVSMIYHVLKSAGLPVGMISTIEVKIGDKSYDSGLHVTTPEPWDVPKYLRMMRHAGIKYVVIETTSNGLHQNRLSSIKFDAAVITNIREDHLDYHKTWENYAEAKFILIKNVKNKGLAVLNADDIKSAKWLYSKSGDLKQTIYAKWATKEYLKNKKISTEGLEFDYDGVHYKVPVLGEHNFDNVLQVIGVCSRYLDAEVIRSALLSFNSPQGRMQLMQSKPFTVIVDFAHTPNALEKALESTNKIKEAQDSRIICVFGCAGKRDKGRRRMGEVSAKLANITILTAEDPRDEELGMVNNDILKHAEKNSGILIDRFATRKLYRASDLDAIKLKINAAIQTSAKPFIAFDENSPRSREDAIEFALKIARAKDIVFITGKGHEKSLAFGDPEEEFPWSDQDFVTAKLAEMAKEA